MAEAGLHNVSFIQSDACEVTSKKPFDAAVGRFILILVNSLRGCCVIYCSQLRTDYTQ